MPWKVSTHRPRPTSPAIKAAADPSNQYETKDSRRADKRFYASTRWRRLRAAFLAENPLCADCKAKGRFTTAVHVHHLLERKDRPDLAHEWSNLQALCQPCHNSKRMVSQ